MAQPRERGVSYFGCRILRHVRRDMAELARHGFTHVVHTVSENDLAFYADSLRDIVAATHDAGLAAHADPWGVGRLFGGEAFSAMLARRPDLRQVDSRGRRHPGLCPGRPESRRLLAEWVDVVAAAGADAVFLDEPHYQGRRPVATTVPREAENAPWCCRCRDCRRRFQERTGTDMPRERTPAVDGFRRETLVSFLRTVARRARDAGLSVTLCVMPPEIGGETTLPLATASTIKEIDVLGTDPYWVHAGLDADALVGSTAAALRHAIEGTETAAQIWIQGFRIPAGRENEIEIAVSAARRAGIENLAVWGFEACASMSHLRSDDPEKTWAAIVRAFSAP